MIKSKEPVGSFLVHQAHETKNNTIMLNYPRY